MQLLKCKAGQLLAEIDGGYWIFTPTHGRLFYGCDREKAVAAWRRYVNNAMEKENEAMNLKAETETEKRILEYLLANASPDLMARIDAEGKTMQGCMKYITSYAKAKIAMDKRHGEVCVSVPPEEVFGQVMHYFEDEAEGAIYKSPEELKREAEAKVAAELREAKRKAEEEEARRKEEERLAALTPEEREAELKAKAEEEARRKLEEDLRREREAEERAKAEAERKAKEAEREAKEKRKREREEAKRKAAEAKERAEKMQPSLFDMMN